MALRLRRLLVTGPDQPYSTNFWKPGHIIGYEHTFIAALGDFLRSLETGESFHPNLEDGLAVEQVLAAVEASSKQNGIFTAVKTNLLDQCQ